MNNISALASSAMAMNQSNLQQRIEMTLLGNSIRAEREVADMIVKNAERLEALAQRSTGGTDLFV
ncbi:MAG: hypothetical protein JW902_04755 [Syntrophaceae bacterium]|nr:hypothetical protein [Syntrophaceae bacterium]